LSFENAQTIASLRLEIVQPESTVVAKRKVLKSQLPLSLLVFAATAVVLTLIYFVYRGFLPHPKCESIFEQTTDRLRGNMDVVKMNGELVLGREKVQELTEGSQKVALP
jgi:hypothetical protein